MGGSLLFYNKLDLHLASYRMAYAAELHFLGLLNSFPETGCWWWRVVANKLAGSQAIKAHDLAPATRHGSAVGCAGLR